MGMAVLQHAKLKRIPFVIVLKLHVRFVEILKSKDLRHVMILISIQATGVRISVKENLIHIVLG